MTKEEALKLALEALDTVMWHGGGSCWVVDADKIEIAITAIKEALAQPEMRPDEISTDELIYMSGRYDGMKQERALWELSKLGQEIEAQPEQDAAAFIAAEDRKVASRYGYVPKLHPSEWQDAQRPWVGLTEVDILAESKHWKNPEDFMDGVYWAETTLKEKNA